jgi:hypothetical protein
VLKMLLPRRTGDQDVIQVDENKRDTCEDLVHHVLERLCSIP